MSVAHFVPVKIPGSDTPTGFSSLADLRHGAFIAMVRTEVVIDMAAKVFVPVEPGADTDENAVIEPFRSVIAGGSAPVRGDIVVAVGAIRSYADSDADLR
jgi:hypothetical protein